MSSEHSTRLIKNIFLSACYLLITLVAFNYLALKISGISSLYDCFNHSVNRGWDDILL